MGDWYMALHLLTPAMVKSAADFDKAAEQIRVTLGVAHEEAVEQLREYINARPVVDYRRAVHDIITRRW
jgi:hypothetical protein